MSIVPERSALSLAILAAQEDDKLRKQLLRKEENQKYVPPVQIFSSGVASKDKKLLPGQQRVLDSYKSMLIKISDNPQLGIKGVGRIVNQLKEWEVKFKAFDPINKVGFFGKNDQLQQRVAPELASMANALAHRLSEIEIIKRRGDDSELGRKSESTKETTKISDAKK